MSTNISYRYLILIISPRLSKNAAALFEEMKVPIYLKSVASGTASSEMLDILGLGSPEKRLYMSILPKDYADAVLKKLKKLLRTSTAGGIAYTLPINGMSKYVTYLYDETTDIPDSGKGELRMVNKYSMITVLVNQGYSEQVMNAARSVGAGGGTVIHSRMIGDEAAQAMRTLDVQDEKEIIMIVATEENKAKIMQEIGKKCGTHSEAKGIVLSMPIENVVGIYEE